MRLAFRVAQAVQTDRWLIREESKLAIGLGRLSSGQTWVAWLGELNSIDQHASLADMAQQVFLLKLPTDAHHFIEQKMLALLVLFPQEND
jgi:hypothetical protein